MLAVRGVAVVVMALGVLAVPATALALAQSGDDAPQNVSVLVEARRPKVTWTLPPDVTAWSIHIGASPDVGPDGEFVQMLVSTELAGDEQTMWRSDEQLRTSTHYVHIGGYDASCTPETWTTECGYVWSTAIPFAVQNAPPTVRAIQ
jgi:hypothetical protein